MNIIEPGLEPEVLVKYVVEPKDFTLERALKIREDVSNRLAHGFGYKLYFKLSPTLYKEMLKWSMFAIDRIHLNKITQTEMTGTCDDMDFTILTNLPPNEIYFGSKIVDIKPEEKKAKPEDYENDIVEIDLNTLQKGVIALTALSRIDRRISNALVGDDILNEMPKCTDKMHDAYCVYLEKKGKEIKEGEKK